MPGERGSGRCAVHGSRALFFLARSLSVCGAALDRARPAAPTLLRRVLVFWRRVSSPWHSRCAQPRPFSRDCSTSTLIQAHARSWSLLFLCLRTRVCVRACVCACVCVCVDEQRLTPQVENVQRVLLLAHREELRIVDGALEHGLARGDGQRVWRRVRVRLHPHKREGEKRKEKKKSDRVSVVFARVEVRRALRCGRRRQCAVLGRAVSVQAPSPSDRKQKHEEERASRNLAINPSPSPPSPSPPFSRGGCGCCLRRRRRTQQRPTLRRRPARERRGEAWRRAVCLSWRLNDSVYWCHVAHIKSAPSKRLCVRSTGARTDINDSRSLCPPPAE